MKSFSLKYNLKPVDQVVNADKLSSFAIFLLLSALSYQAVLCFINTNITTISAAYLMLTEAFLVGIVAINFFKRPISLPMATLLVLVFANTFILVIFQQYFDPKIIRNLMTPIFLIWLGAHYNNKVSADKLLKVFSIIVIAIGVFEILLPQIYQLFFNVIQYQIAMGRSTDMATKYTDSTFSGNGTRWVGRFLFPSLGDHRASSIFLETVSMGNFSVLVASWGLSKQSMREALFFVIAALIIAVLADSRFASFLITLLVLARLTLSLRLLEAVSYLFPFFILLVCFYLGDGSHSGDDFKGRLGSTGYFILNFKATEFFGLYNRHYSMFVDQGYAYILHFCGLIIGLIMWFSFCRLKIQSIEGRTFKSLIGILIAANLAISGDSVFAFKWVAVMWFLLGVHLQNKKVAS